MRPRLYTVRQFAGEVNIGQTMAWKLVREGQVGSVKIGDLRRIPAEEVDRYIARLLNEQSGAAI